MKVVGALHRADWAVEHGATGVLVGFSAIDHGLLADDAFALDFPTGPVSILNVPVPSHQLHDRVGVVGNAYVVREDVAVGSRVGLLFNVERLDVNSDTFSG